MSEELFGIIMLVGLLTVMLMVLKILLGAQPAGFIQGSSVTGSTRDLMSLRYRKHLILPTINQDEDTGAGLGSAHIQYTEKLKFHNVLIRGRGIFWTKAEAEKHVIQKAKEWIDSRLRSDHGK